MLCAKSPVSRNTGSGEHARFDQPGFPEPIDSLVVTDLILIFGIEDASRFSGVPQVHSQIERDRQARFFVGSFAALPGRSRGARAAKQIRRYPARA
jgi:hypothetical protein